MAKATTRTRRRVTPTRKKQHYMVRNVDGALWAAVKQRAAEEGRSVRWVIINLLWLYANQEIDFSKI